MIRSISKLLLFLTPLVGIILLAKQVEIPFIEQEEDLAKLEDATEGSLYFIGSSRVGASINPIVLKNAIGRDVYNLGIGGASFLDNYLMAKLLLEEGEDKVVSIEILSPEYDIKPSVVHFFGERNTNYRTFLSDLAWRDRLNAELLLANSLIVPSIRTELKWLFRSIYVPLTGREQKPGKRIGFKTSDDNNFHSTKTMLKPGHMNGGKGHPNPRFDSFIKPLLDQASKNNSKVIFFLPLTFKSTSKRNQAIAFYHSLPDSLKVVYSDEFLEKMNDPTFLRDSNHLNLKGAKTYTELLPELLAPHLD